MKTTISIENLKEELIAFGITEEKEIEFYIGYLPGQDELSTPDKNQEKSELILAQVEYGSGNPANPINVYIVNLTNRVITVTYTRTVDGYDGTSRTSTQTLQPRERYFVGYHCNTASYSSLCSRYISTRIDVASYN